VPTSQPPAGITIERLDLTSSILDEIGRVGAAAFADDPFFAFLMPREDRRRRFLSLFCRATVGEMGAGAVVHGARASSGELIGVAAFVKPGGWPLSVAAQLRQLRSGLLGLLPRPRALIDGPRYLFAIEHVHPKDEMWYLALLAVDPSKQRGGIGGALQMEVYPEADREGLDSYLETQKQANLAYYRRFGYEVERELHPVKKGPPLWTLRRHPRPPDE
jgi:GNAT superfamily N-acetyltransferase